MNSERISAFVRRIVCRKAWLVIVESLDYFYFWMKSCDVIRS